jgi:hypothetical protein
MDPLLTRIDTEVAAGRPWRAKEIIRGNISNAWPRSDIVERYGQVLLGLGDDVEAGKYLWLSGVRAPAYEKAVALFLTRYGKQGRHILLAQLPKSFRRVEFDKLPADVRHELSAFGVRSGDFGRSRRKPHSVSKGNRWKRWLALAIGLGFFICVIVGAGVGFKTIVGWVARALR